MCRKVEMMLMMDENQRPSSQDLVSNTFHHNIQKVNETLGFVSQFNTVDESRVQPVNRNYATPDTTQVLTSKPLPYKSQVVGVDPKNIPNWVNKSNNNYVQEQREFK